MPTRCHIICFSPTGSTRKIAQTVASGVGLPSAVWDGTRPESRAVAPTLLPGDAVFLASPVYFGRVQQHAAEIFAALRGKGQPTVLLVNYGNRHFDDALLEMHDLALQASLIPVAAAAFVSEHSYSTPDYPMAAGRPDGEDLRKARAFGAALKRKLEPRLQPLSALPGNRPFKPYPDLHRAPETLDACTACGVCADLCPTGAIHIEEEKALTRDEYCIVCEACVKGCPEQARIDSRPGAGELRERLAPLTAERKEPECFL